MLTRVSLLAYSRARPHPTDNLIKLYDLSKIALSVARRDDAGQKINKLRKSYEGQVKKLSIPGKNKALPTPGQFMELLQWPDEEWHAQKESGGKDIKLGLNAASELMAKLDRAVQMTPGKVSEESKWRQVVAADEPRAAAPIDKRTQHARPATAATTAQPSAAASPAVRQAVRPDRTGKKRSYHESSFTGYAEGFADDNDADSTGGEDEGRNTGLNKRRRKVNQNSRNSRRWRGKRSSKR